VGATPPPPHTHTPIYIVPEATTVFFKAALGFERVNFTELTDDVWTHFKKIKINLFGVVKQTQTLNSKEPFRKFQHLLLSLPPEVQRAQLGLSLLI